MSSFNWKQFERRITIDAGIQPQRIYDAWATRAGIESWFLRQAIYTDSQGKERGIAEKVQAGDHYNWRWHGYDDSVVETNQVLDANGKDFFKFSFSGDCIVSVSLLQEAGEQICSLVQDMTMEGQEEQRYFYIECGRGWTFYLANLKSMLEGGIDLRNKNQQIHSVLNA